MALVVGLQPTSGALFNPCTSVREQYMKCHLFKYVLLGVLAITPVGCEQPVVVDDDDGGSTTVIDEDDDVDVFPAPQPGTDVDVDITPGTSGSGTNTTDGAGTDANR
jgi:hypothetical protein